MKLDRRTLLIGSALTGAGLADSMAVAAEGVEPDRDDDGLYTQPWFLDSFLDLKEDHAGAASTGKTFAVLFEQRGCPYCREMHRVNFAKKAILNYVAKNYVVLQLNLWGSKDVTDFDGKRMEERALAQRWKVVFTPTMVFFPKDVAAVAGKPGSETEAFRMPGYFKPYHFLSALEYVHEGHWKTENFQRFIQAKFKELEEKGEKPEIW
jgi:thioredoxin-related protein